jgi:hypothetical protein
MGLEARQRLARARRKSTAAYERRKQTAYHEAGHAVAAQKLGFQVHRVTIVPDDKSRGRMIWNRLPVRGLKDLAMITPSGAKRQRVEGWIIVALAGPLAMRHHNPRSHWKKSGTGYGEMMTKGTDFQIAGELIDILHGDGAVTSAYWRYVRACAEALVEEHWAWIERVALHLLEHGTFDGNIGELNPKLVDIRKLYPDGVPMTIMPATAG